MSAAYLPLPEPWHTRYTRIAEASETFWRQAMYHDHGRQQGTSTWLLLQRILHEVLEKLSGQAPLTAFETFLLRAATNLYEVGWQTRGARELPVAQRYLCSGQVIRESYQQRERASDLGLSKLAPATVELLAELCAAVGQQDLSSLSLQEPDWGGEQETARLRYLVALLQIGDALLVRQKAPYFHNLARFRAEDEPRLALHPYVSFTIESGQITTHLCINPADARLIDTMTALAEEPIRRWWAANWPWLTAELGVALYLHTKPPVNSALQKPLSKTCQILQPYLEACQPCTISLPTPEQIQAACATAAARTARATFVGRQGALPGAPEAVAGNTAVTVFSSYAPKDRRYLEQLETQLALLRREGLIESWSARNIGAGEHDHAQSNRHLESAQIILLLISPDFIASDYAYDVEVRRAMERHAAGETCVIPVLLRPCEWHRAPFGELHALPENGKPVTDRSWHTRDEAFCRIAEGIRQTVERLRQDRDI